jgi:hypothetical protein
LPRHEHFEELAALAVRGELTPSQENELVLHLADCDQCRQVHQEFEELHSPLRASLDPAMDAVIESSRDKVKSAMFQAISLQEAQIQAHFAFNPPLPVAPMRWNALRPVWVGLATAAVLAFVFSLGVRYEQRVVGASGQPPDKPVAVQTTAPAAIQVRSQPDDLQYMQLSSELLAEKQRSARLEAVMTSKDQELVESQDLRTVVQQQLDSQSDELRRTQILLAAKTDQLAQMETAKSNDSIAMVALQYQVQDLTQKLNDEKVSLGRERELLANGRDMRDIIGARNLHIIDVYDTDSGGNTRESFARTFYTEGKSLIFYAYDLPARGTENGKFVYAAWGEKNGNKRSVRNLGILLNDDKAQRRWVLNFSDPKVLAEIDSVFVTLERTGTDAEQPSGKRMLTAYLDSQVNHP